MTVVFIVEPRPECTADPDCPQDQACINERCINPCIIDNPCAPQARCTARAHHPVCTCPEGYGGDPYRQCYRRMYNDNLEHNFILFTFPQRNVEWIMTVLSTAPVSMKTVSILVSTPKGLVAEEQSVW